MSLKDQKVDMCFTHWGCKQALAEKRARKRDMKVILCMCTVHAPRPGREVELNDSILHMLQMIRVSS